VVGTEFRKELNGSRHFLRVPRGIAFDLASLEAAKLAGASRVRVLDRETRVEYRASFEDLLAHGFPLDRGHGRQIALRLEHWTTDSPIPWHKATNVQADRTQAQLPLGI
jgi:hypothetical protein